MKHKVVNKFKIREFCGGAYVFLAIVDGSKKPVIHKDAMIGGLVTEQWYEIPDTNQIAFRLKNEKDLDKIKIGDLVEIKNPLQ